MYSKYDERRRVKRAVSVTVTAMMATGTILGGIAPALAKAAPAESQASVAVQTVHDYPEQGGGGGGQPSKADLDTAFYNGFLLGGTLARQDLHFMAPYREDWGPVPGPKGTVAYEEWLGKQRGYEYMWQNVKAELSALKQIENEKSGTTQPNGSSATSTPPTTSTTQTNGPSVTATPPTTAPQSGTSQSAQSGSAPAGPYATPSELATVPGNPNAAPLQNVPGNPNAVQLPPPSSGFGFGVPSQQSVSPAAEGAAAAALGLPPGSGCNCQSGPTSMQSGSSPTDTGAAATDTGAASTDAGAANPADTGAASTDTGAVNPTDTGAASTDTGAAATDTGATTPTDTGAAQ